MPNLGPTTNAAPASRLPGDVQVISMDFRDVLAGIWRRRLTIILFAVVCGLMAYGVAIMSSARYTTSAQVLVDNLETPFNRAQPNESAANRQQIGPADVQSQVEVMQSRDIAKQVIDKLHLTDSPEFNAAPIHLSLLKRIAVALGFSADPRRQSPEQRALAAYYSKVKAYQIPESKVIVVEASSRDPRMAAALANATTETYVNATREVQSAETRRARTWLSEQIESLRKKVVVSEAAVEEFRAKAGLLKGGSTSTLTGQQLSELSTQIVVAETQRSEAQTKAQSIRELLARTGTVDSSIDVLNSPLIQRLREQQIALKRTLADLSTVYLANHPKIIGVKSQLADLDRQIRAEALKVVQSLEQQAKLAAARETSLRNSLAELKKTASTDNQDEVKLRALEREAAANRTLLETFLARFSDASTRIALDAQPGLARVIARADPPAQPSYPKVGPMVAIGLVGGLILALGIAFLAEVMRAANRVFDTANPLETGGRPLPGGLFDLPARTPETPSLADRLSGFALVRKEVEARQQAVAHAALGPVATWLVDQHRGLDIKRFGVACDGGTDSVAAQGIVELARAAAGEGVRIIVVDAGSREWPLARFFAIDAGKGLCDLVAGHAAFSDVIVRDSRSSVHLLPAGKDDAERPAGERLDMVLDALEQAYDIVLLYVGAVAHDDLAPGRMISKCLGILLFAPASRAHDAGVILEHLRRLGARATRFIKVGAPAPVSDEAKTPPIAANA